MNEHVVFMNIVNCLMTIMIKKMYYFLINKHLIMLLIKHMMIIVGIIKVD